MHGPGVDEPIVWYEGSGTTDRRWLHADRLGSVIAVSDASGAALAINAYDEYGAPSSSNAGRFQYTGQMWLPEAGLYHYKAAGKEGGWMFTQVPGMFLHRRFPSPQRRIC